jgi:hypothetical protein
MNHNKLNQQIYPIYGEYKKTLNIIKPFKSLKLWSNIGEYIDQYLVENPGLTKSKLFRDMYGKAEGAENIEKRGYISREFLQRAHRVYLMELNNQLDIAEDLSSINALGPFREAMPFFDNKKYILKGEERQNLLDLLNSGDNSSDLVNKVKSLQKKYINISNPRTQRLNDLKGEVQIFIDSYNNIFNNYKSNNYDPYRAEDKDNIILLSKYLQCLTAEDFVIPEYRINNFQDKDMDNIKGIVDFLYKNKDAKIRRRFRRLIPIARIRQLSTYIYSIAKDLKK